MTQPHPAGARRPTNDPCSVHPHGGTRLRWDWDTALVGPLRLLTPLLAVMGPGWERRNWVGLKEYGEASKAP